VPRNPYAAHLCAQDPTLFAAGFGFARVWVNKLAPPGKAEQIHDAIRRSSNVAFTDTARSVDLKPSAFVEGFMLGVYGYLALHHR
jgi:hypothetical protein